MDCTNPRACSRPRNSARMQTSRRISMDIRKLAQSYRESELDSLMQRVIPSYCFGLLHVRLTQAWDDATSVLAEMAKASIWEDVITGLVQKWLDGDGSDDERGDLDEESPILNIESDGFQVVSDFECSNLARMSAICKQVRPASCCGPTTSTLFKQILRHSATSTAERLTYSASKCCVLHILQ